MRLLAPSTSRLAIRSPRAGRSRQALGLRRSPALEHLEARQLLAGDAGIFAVIQGSIAPGVTGRQVPFDLSPLAFQSAGGQRVALAIVIQSTSGHAVLGPIQGLGTAAGAVSQPVVLSASPEREVVRLPLGPERLTVLGTPGASFSISFAIAGDMNGDFHVGPSDLHAIRSAIGSRAGSPRFSPAFDINRDGRVTGGDLAIARGNLNAGTSLRPLSTTVALSPLLDPLNRHVVATNHVTFLGQSGANDFVAMLDAQNHVLGTTRANALGQFQLTATLTPGAEVVHVASSDGLNAGGFGQVAQSAALSVQVTPPSFLTKANGFWQFMVNGTPFYMKGVTGDFGGAEESEWGFSYLTQNLPASGANTIRTYGLPDPTLEAQNASNGLALASTLANQTGHPFMLLVGIDLSGVTEAQAEQAITAIEADPNASHILAWVVGNEVPTSQYPMVEDLVKFIHGISSAPVCTSVPNPTAAALQNINTTIPDLDFLGVNSFFGAFDSSHQQTGFLSTLDGTMAASWTKAWAITEYYSYDLPSPPFPGFAGMPFQTLDGGYQYFLELNSTANAANYTACWDNYILSQSQNGNVGGAVLNWDPPHNSQVPAFWKQMFVYDGPFQLFVDPYTTGVSRLQSVDAVTALYGGSAPATPTPQIVVTDGDPQGIVCSFKATLSSPGIPVKAGQTLTASVTAVSSQKLTFQWYLIGGTAVTSNTSPGIIGGPSTNTFEVYGVNPVTSTLVGQATSTTTGTQQNTVHFTMPNVPPGNNYQLRVIITDGQGGAATAAIGFATVDLLLHQASSF